MKTRSATSIPRACGISVDAFTSLAGALSESGVRFVVIGVWGANYYAPSGSVMFTTLDRDLFLPADPDNLLVTWQACEAAGFSLFAGPEPLDTPHDIALARAVVERRALTRATDRQGTDVDLCLVMSGFEFENVWMERRLFDVEGTSIPVARLSHIIQSKALAGREKDLLFLAMHRDAISGLLPDDEDDA